MDTSTPRRPKDFDQLNPPKDITNPAGSTNPQYPAHVHRVNAEGVYALDYVAVQNDDERAARAAEGYHASPDAAIAAYAAEKAAASKGKKADKAVA